MRIARFFLLNLLAVLILTGQPFAHALEKDGGLPAGLSDSDMARQRSLHSTAVDSMKVKRPTTHLTRPTSLSQLSRQETQKYDMKSRYQRTGLTRLDPPDSLYQSGPPRHWVAPLPDSGHHYLRDMYRN